MLLLSPTVIPFSRRFWLWFVLSNAAHGYWGTVYFLYDRYLLNAHLPDSQDYTTNCT